MPPHCDDGTQCEVFHNPLASHPRRDDSVNMDVNRHKAPICTWIHATLLLLLAAILSAEKVLEARAQRAMATISLEANLRVSNEAETRTADNGAILTETDWKDFQNDYEQRFNNRPPPALRPWLHYARKHQCNERDFYSAIDTDIQVFRDIIIAQDKKLFRQEEIVPLGIQQTSFYMGLQLQNHTWTVLASVDYHKKGKRFLQTIQKQLTWLMEPVRAHTPALNATYFFNLHDGSRNENSTRPIFSVCKQAYWTDSVSIPTEDKVRQLQEALDNPNNRIFSPDQQHNYRTFNPQVIDNDTMDAGIRDILVPFYHNLPPLPQRRAKQSSLKFDLRNNTIVWRGSTTGPWGYGPRFQLVRKFGGASFNVPLSNTTIATEAAIVNVDFGFTKIVQGKNKTMPSGFRMAGYLTSSQMQTNKYIMDVDGNSFTERFPALLESGSLVFKSTRYKEWYTERLVPYQDYIPVNYNQSDLIDKIGWAHQHPEFMAKITKNARRTAHQNVRKEDMRCYVYRLMMEYQTLFEDYN